MTGRMYRMPSGATGSSSSWGMFSVGAGRGGSRGERRQGRLHPHSPSSEWPARVLVPGSHPPLGRWGKTSSALIDGLSGKTVSGRKVVVRKAGPRVSGTVPHPLRRRWKRPRWSRPPRRAAVARPDDRRLEGFCGPGRHDRVHPAGRPVGFEINEESARKAGLEVNASFLLGKSVRGPRGRREMIRPVPGRPHPEEFRGGHPAEQRARPGRFHDRVHDQRGVVLPVGCPKRSWNRQPP